MAETEEGFVVRLRADGSEVKAEFASLITATKAFQASLGNIVSTDSFSKLNSGIAAVKANLSSFSIKPIKFPDIELPKIPQLPNIIPPDFKKRTVDATYALSNLGKIANDSAYGFNGIANNLQPALEGFQRLSAQAKEAGVSITSVLLKSLSGAGGLGLALSVVTAAATFASIGFGAWTRSFGGASAAADEHKKKLKDAKDALESYISSLDDVSRANLKGAQSAQDQLVSLQTLYSATQNANIPLAERKKLVDELQEQYPKYFQNISDEAILAGGAATAYDRLSTSILASGRAMAARGQIVEIQQEILTNEKQYAQALQKQYDLQQELNRARAAATNAPTGSAGVGSSNSQGYIAALESAEEKYGEAVNGTNKLFKIRNGLLDDAKRLSDDITGNVIKNGADVLIKPNAKIDKPKPDKSQFEFFDKFFDVRPAKERIEKQIKEMADAAISFANDNFRKFEGLGDILKGGDDTQVIEAGKKFWDSYQKGLIKYKPDGIKLESIPVTVGFDTEKMFANGDISALQNIKFDKLDIKPIIVKLRANVAPELNAEGVPEKIEKFIRQENFKAGIEKALNDALVNIQVASLSGLGEAIGAAISGGDIKAPLQALGSTIGSAVQALGQQFISLGVVAIAAQKAFASLLSNPYSAIAAGVGLVAVSSAFKNLSVPKLAAGGIASKPTYAMIGEYANAGSNPEVVAPLNKLKGMLGDVGGGQGQIVARMRGNDIELIRVRTSKSNRRGG